jgi:PAS domain S-box-containing protein
MNDTRPNARGGARRPRMLFLAAVLGALCAAASALAAQESKADLPLWAALILACVGSGGVGVLITGLLMLRVQRRATNASADKLEVEALDTSVGTVKSLLEEVRSLHEEVTTARDAARAATHRAEELQSEVRQLREQFAATVHSLSAERIGHLADFADMWNLPAVDVPVVFTSAVAGGRFDLVNDAFCRMVERGRDELLGTGWTRFVINLDATREEERAAQRRRVWGFRNLWRMPDGSTKVVEWYAAPYRAKRTMAFAFPTANDSAAIAPRRSPRLHIAGSA